VASTAGQTLLNEEWVAGLANGRDATITALRARIRQGLAAALGDRIDVDDADLDDFTQHAVLRVMERLNTFRGDSRFTTWAMAVAVRVGLTALRRRRWTGRSIDELVDEPTSLETNAGSGHAAGARAELFAALRSAIANELTPRQRRVLMAELEGVPQVVLADQLSSTPGAIYKASHDARKKLKTALTAAGFDVETVNETLVGN